MQTNKVRERLNNLSFLAGAPTTNLLLTNRLKAGRTSGEPSWVSGAVERWNSGAVPSNDLSVYYLGLSPDCHADWEGLPEVNFIFQPNTYLYLSITLLANTTLSPVESGWAQRSGRLLLPRPTSCFPPRRGSSVQSAPPGRETSWVRNVRNLGLSGAPCGRPRAEPRDGKETKYAAWWLTIWTLQRFLIHSFHAESWWLCFNDQTF